MVSLYVLQGLNYAIPMAVLPYLVRVLGMDQYGLLAFSQSFAQYFTMLTDFGFNFSATRSIAQRRHDVDAISRIFSSVLLVKFSLLCGGALILLGIVFAVPSFQRNAPYFYVAYLGVVGNVLFPIWFFQGMEQMRHIAVIIGFFRLAGACLLFILVHRPGDALLALAIQSGTLIAGGIVGLPIALLNRQLRLIWPSLADLHETLTEGWHLFVSTAAISLYTNTNVFMVGLIAGSTQAGYFSAAEKLARAVHGLLLPACQVIFPYASALASRSRNAALQFTRQSLKWIGSISFIISIILLAFARPIMLICLGPNGAGSVSITRWLALIPFLNALSNVLGVQTMVTLGLEKQFSRILIIAGLINLALGILLIRLFLALGAGASMLVTETLIPLLIIISLSHHKIRVFPLSGEAL
jgi:PST family polysaccharide transporter